MNKTILTRVLSIGLLVVTSFASRAQEEKPISLSVETRIGYQHELLDGERVEGTTGFKGQYLNFRIDGNIGKGFSYSYRQRLNKINSVSDYFNAADWIWLRYDANNNWALSAGKQVVGIGGWEYDRAPIDTYMGSEYWNNIACYQFGGSVTYTLNNKKDSFLAQVCQSPFDTKVDNLFAYNLMWYGNHDWFQSIYSINMIEYAPGRYINYIALGNRFKFGIFTFDFDLMNRAASHQKFLFDDFSIMSEIACSPNPKWNFYAKVTYDKNAADNEADLCVLPGTEMTQIGAGIQYYPLRNKHEVQLHAAFAHSFGDNSNPAGVILDKRTFIEAGFKLKFKVL